MLALRVLMLISLLALVLVTGYGYHALSKKQRERDELHDQLVALQQQHELLAVEANNREDEIQAMTKRLVDLQHQQLRTKAQHPGDHQVDSIEQEPLQPSSPNLLTTTTKTTSTPDNDDLKDIHENLQRLHSSSSSNSSRIFTRILIGVMSTQTNFAQREAIRRTWGSYITDRREVLVIFFLADIKWASNETLVALQREMVEKGDVICLKEVREEYKALGERLYHMLFEVAARYEFDYFTKTDDDSYLKVPLLRQTLIVHSRRTTVLTSLNDEGETQELPDEEVKGRRMYWGFFMHSGIVQGSNSRWYNPEYLRLNTHYPAYAAGSGYVITRDLFDWLVNSEVPLKVWRDGPEDSQLGTWLSGLDIERINARSEVFGKGASSNCDGSTVVLHGLGGEQEFFECYEADVQHNDLCSCPWVQNWANAWKYTGKTGGGGGGGGGAERRQSSEDRAYISQTRRESLREAKVRFVVDLICWILIAGVFWLLFVIGVVLVIEKILLCLESS